MSFNTFSSDFDPLNPEQQIGLPVIENFFEDPFADHGLGLRQLLPPQQVHFGSQDFISEPELDFMQNMITSDIPALEQELIQQPQDPELLPDISDQPTELLLMQNQDIDADLSFMDALQFEDTDVTLSEQVPRLDPQVQQQPWQLENLLNEFAPPQGTEQPPIPVHNLGHQREETKENLKKKGKSTTSLRLRMRLQPNAGPQKQLETGTKADAQFEDLLQPQPSGLQPIQVGTLSDPFSDLFGHSGIPMMNHVPRRPEPCDIQVQPEHVPNEDNSVTTLPFWKAEKPSNMPAYDFLLEEGNSSDPLAVLNTNLFANEITESGAEVLNGSLKGGRKAVRKGNTNGIERTIEGSSDLTRTELSENEETEGMLVHDLPPNFSANGTRGKKTRGRRNMQANEQEPRRQRRVAPSICSTYSDSEEDEEDGNDPSYVPEKADEHSEEPTDHFSDPGSPEAVEHQHPQTPTIALTFCDPSNNRTQEEMSASQFHSEHVTCPQCKDVFANSDSMDRHFRLVHSKPKGKVYTCEECQQTCRNEQNLRRHWNNAHSGELIHICAVCNARFSTKRSLSLHRTKQHPDVYKPRPKRKKNKFHECQMCDYTSDQSYNVIRHFFTKHTDNVAMECLHGCGKTFKSVSNAKVHFPKCKHRPSNNE